MERTTRETSSVEASRSCAAPLNVLIIENCPEFRADVRQMLTYASGGTYQFMEGENGKAGVRLADQLAVTDRHCALLSCDLPDMQAQEVIAALMGSDGLTRFPIVVVGLDKNADGRAYIRQGAQDYVGRNGLTSSGLLVGLENAVERFNLIRENKRTMAQLLESEARLSALLRETENRRLELHAIMEAVPAQVWISRDRECRRIFGNRAVYEFVGCDAGQNVSMTAPLEEKPSNFETYRHGAVVPVDELPMQSAARTGRSVRGVDLELRFSDGTSKWIYGNAEPLRDAAGNLCGAIAGMVDFTAQKQAYDELAQREHVLRSVVDALPGFFFVLSPEGVVVEGNGAGWRWVGRDRAEVVHQPWDKVFAFAELPASADAFRVALRKAVGGEATTAQVVERTSQGKAMLHLVLKPVHQAQGKPGHVLVHAQTTG